MTTPVVTKFNFKTRTIKDDQGKELGKLPKLPSVEVALPFVSAEEVVAILSRPVEYKTDEKTGEQVAIEDKEKTLVLDAINGIVRDQAKSQFEEIVDNFTMDENRPLTPADIDFDKLTLSFIATIPPAQRGAKAIPEEDYQTFYLDYMPVMVAATGKPEAKIKNHIDLFQKPTRIKQNKEALQALIDSLDIYISSTKNLDDTGEVADRIRTKFDRWLKADDKFDVNAL